VFLPGLFLFSPPILAQETLIPLGSSWKYLDNGSDQRTKWRKINFEDRLWSSGPAQLGYGDGDEASIVGYGPNPKNKFITTYFRHTFSIPDPSIFGSLKLRIIRDDGAVVYINGTEVLRSNMPTGPITADTKASTAVGGGEEKEFNTMFIDMSSLVPGKNVVAVEIHQVNKASSDISFVLELTGHRGPIPVSVTRGPYLQLSTPGSIVVRWRTNTPTESRVYYGMESEHLVHAAKSIKKNNEHEVTLKNLSPNTKYFYAVGNASKKLAGADETTFFITPPLTGKAKPTRIWVCGDSGTGDANARAVRDAYKSFTGNRYTDVWLMLGDNAYKKGTDEEHQKAVFDTFPVMLRQVVLWPTLGNHELYSSDSPTQTGAYFDIFTLPTAGEGGGFPSGTEAYYSFNYGDIHFITLDSYDTDLSPNSKMLNWLKKDLAATSSKWLIAYWHHPPYSKGSHDSDKEKEMIQIRKNVLPILESRGVDLVLTGHSHAYERSMLITGHYGSSNSLNRSMILDSGTGQIYSNQAYRKATIGLAPHEGTVYVVAGSSGKIGGGPLNHPIMKISFNRLGSLVLDIDKTILQASFIDSSGVIIDRFTIEKGESGATVGNLVWMDKDGIPDKTVKTQVVIVPKGSKWKYRDNGIEPGKDWKNITFDDSSWSSGPAQLGYGDNDEATKVGYGPNTKGKFITTWFRHNFKVTKGVEFRKLSIFLLCDDGAVVYLNGTEVLRHNMPSGKIHAGTNALAAVGGKNESRFYRYGIPTELLRNGTNILAAEIHQANNSSSDVSFDLELAGSTSGN